MTPGGLAALTTTALRRLLREPLLVRALVAPIVLLTLVPFGTALLLAALEAPPEIAVADADARAALADAGLWVVDDPDPATAVSAGRVRRAAWPEGGRWVLAAAHGGRWTGGEADRVATRRAEAALRDQAGAGWRFGEGPPTPPGPASSRAVAGLTLEVPELLGGLLGAIFALFGAALGVGVVSRDRAALEADLALPVPAAAHALALITAAGIALLLPEATLLALYEAALPGDAGLWSAAQLPALLAPIEATALALALATWRSGWVGGAAVSTGRGLTGALAGAAALLALGAQAPAVGAWLPIAHLSAMAFGEALPQAGQVARAACTVAAVCALVQARVGR